MSMAFYARDSQIVILEIGDFKSQIGMADYLKLPQLTILNPVDHQQSNLDQSKSIVDQLDAKISARKSILLSLFKKYEIDLVKNDFPVLLLTRNESKREMEQMMQIMFETLNVPGLYLLDSSLASLYACGLVTGLVIDIGYNSTRICPVFENGVLKSAIVETPIGSKDIDNYLQKETGLKGVELLKFKQECVLCSMSSIEAEKVESMEFKGKKYGNIRSKCMEILFDPKLVQKHIITIQEAIGTSIKHACEGPKRVTMWENMILTGGCSEIKGN